MSGLTAFPILNKLPAELRNKIWRDAGEEDAENDNIVEVKMRRTPFLTRAGPFNNTRPWRLSYSFGLADRNPSLLLSTTREA